MADKRFFVRAQGKILGPFSLAQLATLRDRGQFARFHEVSEDRRTWLPATTLGELFPTADAPATYTPVAEPAGRVERVPAPAPAAQADAAWYFGRDGKQFGPYAFDVLRQAAATGQLTPTDLVWQQGMPAWVPAQQVRGLTFGKPAAARSSRRRKLLVALVPVAVLLLAGLPLLYFFVLRPWLRPVQVSYLSSNASAQEITEAYRPKVYLVQSSDGTGSGLMLARDRTRGLIITNHHVLDAKMEFARMPELLRTNVRVKTSAQLDFRPAQVAAIHKRLDVALLLLEMDPDKPAAVAVLRKNALRQGEEAVALGNPLGLPFFTSSGVISSTSSTGGYIWTSCPISKGNSGGPLFLKRRGFWVGVNTLKLGDIGLGAENLNAAIPAEEVMLALHGPQQESWTWNEGHKDQVVALAKLVPLEE